MHKDTSECTPNEKLVLKWIIEKPAITREDLVIRTGISESTVKRIVKALQEKQYIRRVNGKRFGSWEVLIENPRG